MLTLAAVVPAVPLLAVLLVLVALIKSSFTYASLLKVFPSPDALPLIGHAKAYWGDEVHVFKLMRRYRKAMGSMWVIKLMNEHALNMCDIPGFEAVMTSSKHIKKGPLYEFLLPWLGRGLLTNEGASWHHRRKLLTPAFHFKILDEFGPLLAHHAEQLVGDLKEAGFHKRRQAVDVVEAVSKATLGTICETAMGVNLKSLGEGDEYFESVRTVSASVIYRMLRPWTWNDFVFHKLTPHGRLVAKCMAKLHRFTEKVIRERKASEGGRAAHAVGDVKLHKRRLAFLDMLLAAQQQDATLSDLDIRNEVDTFMFEGHETTAMAICWTLFALGNNPDIQERVRDEVLAAGTGWQDVVALPYLEQVVKESLRMYPPVMYISRLNENGLDIGNKHVPAGLNLDMLIFEVHRDPEVFPDPERFDPERFSPEQERGRHPFAYVPFSGGLRNCIGKRYAMMELKLMVASVLRAFSWRSKHSHDQIEFRPELVLRASQGIQLYLTPL